MEIYKYYLIPELLKPLKICQRNHFSCFLDDVRVDRVRGSEG